jgi:hemerythrin-like domain-containing protein
MKPVAPLMIEHRLIERMVKLLNNEIQAAEKGRSVNSALIFSAIDFFRMYADRTHHGKEEDILFRDLKKKKLSSIHQMLMEELVADHVLARNTVKELQMANEMYAKGNPKAITEIKDLLKKLVDIYPGHIKKEDRDFFLPVMNYFTQEDQDRMLAEFNRFDQTMIHYKYTNLVEQYEKQ